jgi:trk system potassium uptake protein
VWKQEKARKTHMRILIVGGGKLVYFLTRTFTSKGHEVIVINKDRQECSHLARRIKATVVYGDGSDPQILAEAGAAGVDAVLAVTHKDQDNLVICQLASFRFDVPRTLALVNDPDHEEVFKKLKLTSVLSTTRILSSLIEQRTDFDDIINLVPIGEGRVNITEIILKETSPIVGQTLSEIDLPENSLIATIMREEEIIVPRGQTILQTGDRLVLITLPDNYAQVLKRITGEHS